MHIQGQTDTNIIERFLQIGLQSNKFLSQSCLNQQKCEMCRYMSTAHGTLIHCANKQMHGDIELENQRRMKCADDKHVARQPQAAEEVRRRKCRDCLTPANDQTIKPHSSLLKSLFLLSWRRKTLSHLHILQLQIFGKEVSGRKWEDCLRPTTEQSTAIFFLVCPVHRI